MNEQKGGTGNTVKNTYCSDKELRFSFQHMSPALKWKLTITCTYSYMGSYIPSMHMVHIHTCKHSYI